MEYITSLLVALLIVLIAKWIWQRWTVQQTWERLGVKGPEASSLFFGNMSEATEKGHFKIFKEWTKMYGKVFGYYEAGTPVLVTADLDMIKEIMIKQFDNFSERRGMVDARGDKNNHLVDMDGEQWKRVRGISSPTFNAKRMKQMSPLIHQSIDKLMKRFSKRVQDDKPFDIYEDLKRLTLDVIASTVFSYDTDVFNDENSIFLQKLIELLQELDITKRSYINRIKLTLIIIFPKLLKLMKVLDPEVINPKRKWFTALSKKMITDRQQSGEYRTDYIQAMLDIHQRSDDNLSGGESDNEEDIRLRRRFKNKKLTMEEMEGQTFIFLVAGYETTSTTLAFLSYYMALYPEVQSRLQQEIDEYFPDYADSRNVNYETVQQLPYLDMVFCETSRLGSIAQLVINRMCHHTTDVCGVTIPKDARIFINVQQIHQSQELWGPEPVDQFVPERFSKERKGNRHPMAYLAFGSGPRNCIGMRFAIMEAKMEVINMLKRFTIVKCPETQVPLPLNKDALRGPSDGVFVKLISRN